MKVDSDVLFGPKRTVLCAALPPLVLWLDRALEVPLGRCAVWVFTPRFRFVNVEGCRSVVVMSWFFSSTTEEECRTRVHRETAWNTAARIRRSHAQKSLLMQLEADRPQSATRRVKQER